MSCKRRWLFPNNKPSGNNERNPAPANSAQKRKWLVTKTYSCKVFTKDLNQIIKDGSSLQWFDKKCFQSFHLNGHTTRLCSQKIEASPVLWICETQCAQHMISMKKKKFSGRARTKVRPHHRPLGSARAQLCTKVLYQWLELELHWIPS